MTDRPIRVQLRRTKGWKMPPNTVSVARGPRRKWGNPFKIGDFGIPDGLAAKVRFREWLDGFITGPKPPNLDEVRDALRGKNLACWCPLDQPCHVDVLLDLAND